MIQKTGLLAQFQYFGVGREDEDEEERKEKAELENDRYTTREENN